MFTDLWCIRNVLCSLVEVRKLEVFVVLGLYYYSWYIFTSAHGFKCVRYVSMCVFSIYKLFDMSVTVFFLEL